MYANSSMTNYDKPGRQLTLCMLNIMYDDIMYAKETKTYWVSLNKA